MVDDYGLSVWHRYRRMLGNGGSEEWDCDSGTTHAVRDGRTLCGWYVRGIRDGWERNSHARFADASHVECGNYRRVLGAKVRE